MLQLTSGPEAPGRLVPGIAVKLWHKGQTAALSLDSVSEILAADRPCS